MTPLAGLNRATVSHQEAHAQPDAPRRADRFGQTAVQSPTTQRRSSPLAGEEEARWVHTEEELVPRPTVSAMSRPRGSHGIP
jgi:hypothetical protein